MLRSPELLVSFALVVLQAEHQVDFLAALKTKHQPRLWLDQQLELLLCQLTFPLESQQQGLIEKLTCQKQLVSQRRLAFLLALPATLPALLATLLALLAIEQLALVVVLADQGRQAFPPLMASDQRLQAIL